MTHVHGLWSAARRVCCTTPKHILDGTLEVLCEDESGDRWKLLAKGLCAGLEGTLRTFAEPGPAGAAQPEARETIPAEPGAVSPENVDYYYLASFKTPYYRRWHVVAVYLGRR